VSNGQETRQHFFSFLSGWAGLGLACNVPTAWQLVSKRGALFLALPGGQLRRKRRGVPPIKNTS